MWSPLTSFARALTLGLLFTVAVSATGPEAFAKKRPSPDPARSEISKIALFLFDGRSDRRREALEAVVGEAGTKAIPALILALRYATEPEWRETLDQTLAELAGTPPKGRWFEWMLWLQAHPEIMPFDGHGGLIADVFAQIDPNFRTFLYEGVAHEIRLEEITWGGVLKDGIPDLTNPRFLKPGKKPNLTDGELVFGVEINGDARAYPLRILDWHELFNDVIGGVPVSLAYCTLCGSGILFEGKVEGRDEVFTFGTSGFLYRSNKLMYDKVTHSLWNQFTGRPVVGPLTGSGIKLKVRPVTIARWADWREAHPATKVLSPRTGHSRDYRPGAAYGDYFASPDLIFPHRTDDRRLTAKDYVFVLRGATEKAWPLSRFKGGAVINDTAGVLDVVLIGKAEGRTVRAYRSDGIRFEKGPSSRQVIGDGMTWQVTEAALVSEDGRELSRLPGHVAYWFAFAGFLEGQGELAAE